MAENYFVECVDLPEVILLHKACGLRAFNVVVTDLPIFSLYFHFEIN